MPTRTYRQLAATTLTSGASNISFANIDQTYTDLRVVIQYKHTNSGYALGLRFNDDSSGNYCSRNNFAINGSASYNLKNSFVFGGINIQNTDNGGLYSVAIIDILDYNQTDTFKTYMIQNSSTATQSSSDTSYGTGHWFKSSKEAITKISFAECGDGGSGTWNTGNLATGTNAILYGIKAGS